MSDEASKKILKKMKLKASDLKEQAWPGYKPDEPTKPSKSAYIRGIPEHKKTPTVLFEATGRNGEWEEAPLLDALKSVPKTVDFKDVWIRFKATGSGYSSTSRMQIATIQTEPNPAYLTAIGKYERALAQYTSSKAEYKEKAAAWQRKVDSYKAWEIRRNKYSQLIAAQQEVDRLQASKKRLKDLAKSMGVELE